MFDGVQLSGVHVAHGVLVWYTYIGVHVAQGVLVWCTFIGVHVAQGGGGGGGGWYGHEWRCVFVKFEILYSSQHQGGLHLYIREGFLIPGCGTRTPEYVAARRCADVRSTA